MTKFITTISLAIAAFLAVPVMAQTIGAPGEAESIVLTEEPAELAQKLAEFADLERKHGEQMQELFAQDPADALKAFRAMCDEELALLEPLLESAQACYADIAAGIDNAPAAAKPDNASHQMRESARMANLLGVKLSSPAKRAMAMQLKPRGSRKASWSKNADAALTTVNACQQKIEELKALRSLSSIYQVQATLNSLDHKLDESPIVKAFDAWADNIDADAEASFDDPLELEGDLQDLGARDFRNSNY